MADTYDDRLVKEFGGTRAADAACDAAALASPAPAVARARRERARRTPRSRATPPRSSTTCEARPARPCSSRAPPHDDARRRRLRSARRRRSRRRSGPRLTFRARMRYDADYGASGAETRRRRYRPLRARASRAARSTSCTATSRAAASSRARSASSSVASTSTDALGWWSFDGGQVKRHDALLRRGRGLRRPRAARRACRSRPPRFERDGVWRGDRTRHTTRRSTRRSSRTTSRPRSASRSSRPAFTWLHGRLTYRRVYNTGASNVSRVRERPLAARSTYDGHAHLAGAPRLRRRRARCPTIGGVKGGFAYDLYDATRSRTSTRRVDAYVAHEAHAQRRLRLLRADVRRRLDLELLRARCR